jgi:non-heme chloroperoxidase
VNVPFLLFLCVLSVADLFAQLKIAGIGGAQINYVDKGSGVPVVFVHGGLEDYRNWYPQEALFSKDFRFISYSRRFSYPNKNNKEVTAFSAETEADDLAKLIIKLKLPPVHLVGHSFGALVALTLAIRHPQLLKSLTLSEPPMVSWLRGLVNGQRAYDDFQDRLLKPLRKDFESNDTTAIVRHTLIFFYGSNVSQEISAGERDALVSNLGEWRAMAMSDNLFPPVSKQAVQKLTMPILLLSAGRTMPMLQITNAELKRILPSALQFNLPEGTHDYWITNPAEMGNAVIRFIKSR